MAPFCAEEAGNEVKFISLKEKERKRDSLLQRLPYLPKTRKCVIKDEVIEIVEKMKNADTIVFATPIYYYEMSGQMKMLLDQLNPLYGSDYQFRNVYLLSVAAEDEANVPENAKNGLHGWSNVLENPNRQDSYFLPASTIKEKSRTAKKICKKPMIRQSAPIITVILKNPMLCRGFPFKNGSDTAPVLPFVVKRSKIKQQKIKI